MLILYGAMSMAEYVNRLYLDINRYDHSFQNVSSNIFVLAEFIVFCLFLKDQIRSDAGRRMMLFFLQFFPIVVCFYWLYGDSLTEAPTYLIVVESLILIISSLCYFHEILTAPHGISGVEHPSFLIICGMLLLSVFAIPLSLFMDNTYSSFNSLYYILFSIKCFAYIILFTFFIIALKCQTRKK